MPEHAHSEEPRTYDEQEQISVRAPAVSGVPEDWKKYNSTFYDMYAKLKPVKRNDIDGDDLQSFLQDLEEFDDYIVDSLAKENEYVCSIKNVDDIKEIVVNLINAVVSTSRVWNRYKGLRLSMKDLAENDDAYAERLSRCYDLVRDILRNLSSDNSS